MQVLIPGFNLLSSFTNVTRRTFGLKNLDLGTGQLSGVDLLNQITGKFSHFKRVIFLDRLTAVN